MIKKTIMGAGAVLVDLLIEETDDFVNNLVPKKGGMTLVGRKKINEILEATSSRVKTVPGGSACNTLVGISALGGKTRMIGRSGKDRMGEVFRDGLEKAGVEGVLSTSETDTGVVLSIITPDAQRTMFTFLGASGELSPADIKSCNFSDAFIVHLEGYLLFNIPVVDAIIRKVRDVHARLCLDLASFQVVETTRDYLKEIIKPKVNILIANEDEARAYTGRDEKESLEIFSQMVEIAVVKLGKKGALVAKGEQRISIDAEIVDALDTTGAGDLWASGFLYGLTNGYSLENAARLGARVASEVVQVMGAVIPSEGWSRINDFKRKLEKK
jgi:sugar/nucleoside kinase (ribokinase family)